MNMPIASAGKQAKVVDEQRVVVYRTSDGGIVHVHEVVTFEGADAPSRDHVEKSALAHAADRGQRSGVATLHVGARALKVGTGYRVDVGKRELVEFELPIRKR